MSNRTIDMRTKLTKGKQTQSDVHFVPYDDVIHTLNKLIWVFQLLLCSDGHVIHSVNLISLCIQIHILNIWCVLSQKHKAQSTLTEF